jgi:hypothetical protein
MTHYHVSIRNTGAAARVIHDGVSQKPIRIGAGETVEEVLDEDTINRLQREKPVPEEPKLELTKGDKVADAETPQPPMQRHQTDDVEEAVATQHKRRPAHG